MVHDMCASATAVDAITVSATHSCKFQRLLAPTFLFEPGNPKP